MRSLIEPGERAPDFVLPRGDGRARLYGHVGGEPLVLLFGCSAAGVQELGRAIATALPDGSALQVVTRASDEAAAEDYLDEGGQVHASYGIDADAETATVVVLDRNLRTSEVVVDVRWSDAERVADVARGLLVTGAARRQAGFAPVLLVPEAVNAAMREELVAAWDGGTPSAGEVETMADGRREDSLDALSKRRRDVVVRDRELLRRLTSHVGRRVIPEVERAFAFRADRFEGFKIGAYEAGDTGFFAAHRDNLSPATAHRRFALSINLNDEYEGGELCFPEYGPDLYRPAAGEALIFSGSLLHEVRPVTTGHRFVLLSFLFDGS